MAAENWKIFFEDLQQNWDSIPEYDRNRIYYTIDTILGIKGSLSDSLLILEGLCRSTAVHKQRDETLEEVNSIESIWEFLLEKRRNN